MQKDCNGETSSTVINSDQKLGGFKLQLFDCTPGTTVKNNSQVNTRASTATLHQKVKKAKDNIDNSI